MRKKVSPDFYRVVGNAKPLPVGKMSMDMERGGNMPTVGVDQGLEVMGEDSGWGKVNGDSYISVAIHSKHLESALYRPIMTQIGITIQAMPLVHDTLLQLADSKSLDVVEEIRKFRGLKGVFAGYGLLHKRGILLWGPPGSGKTCTISLILKLLVEEGGGVALQIERPSEAALALRMIRKVEPERQIVCILEDIDALVDKFGESEFLALLDGEAQINNVVFVATTNYPERLDKRFVDRPSRFDTIIYVGMPSAAARREYLLSKDKGWVVTELEKIVKKTHGFSIAHLREVFILIKCFGYSAGDAVAKVDGMRGGRINSADTPDRMKLGFARE